MVVIESFKVIPAVLSTNFSCLNALYRKDCVWLSDLRKAILHYVSSKKCLLSIFQSSVKEIPLECAEIAESEIDKKLNVFSIKPKNSKRTYYIQANCDEHRTSWMEALCYAKLNGVNDGNSEACVLQ